VLGDEVSTLVNPRLSLIAWAGLSWHAGEKLEFMGLDAILRYKFDITGVFIG
jgi:hypothetical protein